MAVAGVDAAACVAVALVEVSAVMAVGVGVAFAWRGAAFAWVGVAFAWMGVGFAWIVGVAAVALTAEVTAGMDTIAVGLLGQFFAGEGESPPGRIRLCCRAGDGRAGSRREQRLALDSLARGCKAWVLVMVSPPSLSH